MCYSKIKFSCLIHHHTMQKAAAKVRISEQKTKEKSKFLCFFERKYFRNGVSKVRKKERIKK